MKQFKISKTLPSNVDTLVLLLDSDLNIIGAKLSEIENKSLKEFLDIGDFKGKIGEVIVAYNLPGFVTKRVVLAGFGNGNTCSGDIKLVFKTIYSKLELLSVENVAFSFGTNLSKGNRPEYRTALLVLESLNYAKYKFKKFITKDKKADKHADNCSCCCGINEVYFIIDSDNKEFELGLIQGKAVSKGIKLARDLGNLPANICTPEYLGQKGLDLENKYNKITTTLVKEDQMKDLGMGCYLAVAQGTVNRPVMTIMEYKGASKDQKPIVIVGKGMTFDAGGISIKPAAGMAEMKYDMCGAASVFGVINAVAELNLPVNVVGVAAGCENLLDANSYRPGDIVTSMKGLTVTIDNTDAEGRLVLADTLTYVGKYDPKFVIDVATLTGAVLVALGTEISGLVGNDQSLVDDLLRCGKFTHDLAWQLPLGKYFTKLITGHQSDLVNSGGRFGGSSSAGAFLSEFTKDYKWAHLDIAGTAWKTGIDYQATGRPVSLLVEFISSQIKS